MGALAKINRLQVWIIAAVLSIIAVVGIYIGLIRPLNERMAAADAKYQTNEPIALEDPRAKEDRRKAQREVAEAKSRWARYDRALMPTINLENLFTAQRQLWNEQINVLGPKVLRFLNADRTVTVVSQNIQLPAPPSDPNAVARKVFTYPLGQVVVAGRFNEVLNHAQRWNNFDRLALVEGLALSGNSPRLNGSYTLTVYEFTQADKVGPAVPQAAPSTGGFGFPGGDPAMGGGFPGGFPGGDPAMGGPPPGDFGPGGIDPGAGMPPPGV